MCKEIDRCPKAMNCCKATDGSLCDFKPELPKRPQPEQAEASSLSTGLCCPWDKYIKESDGNFKDFGAWERWLNELDDAILEDMEIELRSSLYGIMIDMLKAT